MSDLISSGIDGDCDEYDVKLEEAAKDLLQFVNEEGAEINKNLMKK